MIEELTPLLLATASLLVLLIAAPLTLLLSIVILWRYRRRVLQAMAATAPNGSPPGAIGGPAVRPEPPATTAGPADASRGLRRMTARCLLAGLVFATVLTLAAVLAFPLYRSGWRPALPLWTYLWPTALALLSVGPTSLRWRAGVLAVYAAPWCLGALAAALSQQPTIDLMGVAGAHRATITPPAVLLGWLTINSLPTTLWLLFLNSRLRAVGPLVLAVVTPMAAALVIGWLALYTPAGMALAESVFAAIDIAPVALLASLLVGVPLAGAALGWAGLAWLRRGYLRRSVNDRTITVDALWMVFATCYAIGLALGGPAWTAAAVLAWFAAKAAMIVAERWSPTRPLPPRPGRGLSFLRVFSLGRRSERLFEALVRRWRHIGSVQLISGPDLALATAQPHQLLDFVSGRLARHFIGDEAVAAQRLAARERGPDRDGLFRINGFFCHADTWQVVLRGLVGDGDQVLMDLRSLGPQHAGCSFELTHLVHAVPLARWLLVVDADTDMRFLDETLAAAWRSLPADSPNRGCDPRAVRLHRLRTRAIAESELLALLCADGIDRRSEQHPPVQTDPGRPHHPRVNRP